MHTDRNKPGRSNALFKKLKTPVSISIQHVMIFVLISLAHAAEPHLYTTGPLTEIDRCASAWLIKRHVDVEATFRFYPEGDLITEGTPFDTPEAQLRRTHRFSTFEAIMAKYNLKDDKLRSIATIIHDVEINAWEKRKEYRKILHDIKNITDSAQNDEERLNDCIHYFDQFPGNNEE